LVDCLRGAAATADGRSIPVAVVWTDPNAQWRGAVEALRARMPEFVELGAYAPVLRRGPAPWIRCVVDGALPLVASTDGCPVVVYLPGVGRQHLRAGEDCPDELQPLIELVYRGELWVHEGGHDWTVSAFLKSPRTLGLDLASDRATNDALLRALREVLVTPVATLRGRRLEAEDFDRLLTSDVPRDVLRWLATPDETKRSMGTDRWAAFVNQSRSQLSFDPDRDGPLTAAERLCAGGGAWEAVWSRFVEAPQAFGGIVQSLERAQPSDLFQASVLRWPSLNATAEDDLRGKLADLEDVPHRQACEAVLEFETEHAARRASVWARLGRAPLAIALDSLARIARAATKPMTGATATDIASAYEREGWIVDAATWEAVASVADGTLRAEVARVIAQLAEPWLDESARALQRVIARTPLASTPPIDVGPGACILFVDGLRYDVARRLAERLEGRGCRLELATRWSRFPSVTATAKPFVSPAVVAGAAVMKGSLDATDFAPSFISNGKPVVADSLRVAIVARGYQVILGTEKSGPAKPESRGWCEYGDLDSIGHKLESDLARHLPDLIEQIADRVTSLFDAGWSSIRIVTDHGWLLLPEGLPKIDLPKHLTETRWSRCAMIKGAAPDGIVAVPWSWNPAVTVATAPGIKCFNKSPGYVHGGVSVQECLVPDFTVTRGAGVQPPASIVAISWIKMRCVFECAGTLDGARADLRLGTPHGKSIVGSPKPIGTDGTANFVVEDDYEAKDLVLVLCDSQGTVIAQRSTRVGVSS